MNNIGSYIIDSFQEYEGEHSLVLFYVGCNMRCKGCYNYNILSTAKNMYSAKYLIDKYITPLHTAVVFLGGEPTIHNIIPDLEYAKSKGLKTKIYTNGMNPLKVAQYANLELMDAISIDFKCIDNCKERLGVESNEHYLEAINETVSMIRGIIKYNYIDMELRTTKFPFLSDNELMRVHKEVDSLIHFYGNIRYIVQDYIETETNL